MSFLNRTVAALRSYFVEHDKDLDDQRKRLFIGMVLLVGIAVLVAFGINGLVSGDAVEGTLELVVAGLFGFSAIRLSRAKRVGRLTMAAFSIFLIYVGVTGGVAGSKMLWIFVLPHVLLFILGSAEGFLWNLGVLATAMTAILIRPAWVYPYSTDTIVRFAVTYVIISATALILEMVRQDYRERMVAEQERLEKAMQEVETLSITDGLTGVYNRGYMDRRLPEECSRARRYGSQLSVVICDVDHFKQVNDQHGHQVGDTVLRAMCATLAEGLRHEIDWIARYGGEEFLIVLPETGHSGAMVVAERLRQSLEASVYQDGSTAVTVTGSFGVAALGTNGQRDLPYEEIIQEADRKLYRAKQDGRNRVVG